MATVKTDKIVRDLCRMADGDDRLYGAFLSSILLGIKDMMIFNVPCFRYVRLKISNFNSVFWPPDCIKPLVVGLERNNRIVALDVDEGIVPQSVSSPKTTLPDYEDVIDGFFDGRCELNRLCLGSASLGEWYGYDGNYNDIGYVRHDKRTRQTHIVGRLKTGDYVLMFYQSDGLEECPEEVPSEIESALRYFALHWHFIMKQPNAAEAHLVNYKKEFTRLNKFYQDEGKQAWVTAMRTNDKSSPK